MNRKVVEAVAVRTRLAETEVKAVRVLAVMVMPARLSVSLITLAPVAVAAVIRQAAVVMADLAAAAQVQAMTVAQMLREVDSTTAAAAAVVPTVDPAAMALRVAWSCDSRATRNPCSQMSRLAQRVRQRLIARRRRNTRLASGHRIKQPPTPHARLPLQ